MAKTFKQSARFSASPTKIYRSFLDEKMITEKTGMSSRIVINDDGGRLTVGDVKGWVLDITRNKRIVLDLRTATWAQTPTRAICTIVFEKEDAKTSRIEIFTSNVPDHNVEEIKTTWKAVLDAIQASID